jgi:tripartite-type tricarboxylate transporter receptor subunit TctC
MNEVFGTKFRVIEGYKGSQESLLALEKDEVEAHVSGGSSPNFRNRFVPWVKDGKVVVLLQMGLEKDPAFPDAPLVVDLPMKDEDKQLFELVFAEQIMGRPFLAPPKVPADRVKALRDAFDATMKDKAYLADAAKQKLEINPVRGERINQLLDAVYSRPKVLLDRMRQAVQ